MSARHQHRVTTANAPQKSPHVVERISTAYAALFTRQCAMVYSRCRVDWATAQDIVQQAYINLLRRNTSPTFSYPYVWQAVRFAMSDYWRKEHRQCRDVRRTQSLTSELLNTISGETEVQ
jgi:DNA-directed RNA polymerase specialized sigma24 family protein